MYKNERPVESALCLLFNLCFLLILQSWPKPLELHVKLITPPVTMLTPAITSFTNNVGTGEAAKNLPIFIAYM